MFLYAFVFEKQCVVQDKECKTIIIYGTSDEELKNVSSADQSSLPDNTKLEIIKIEAINRHIGESKFPKQPKFLHYSKFPENPKFIELCVPQKEGTVHELIIVSENEYKRLEHLPQCSCPKDHNSKIAKMDISALEPGKEQTIQWVLQKSDETTTVQ